MRSLITITTSFILLAASLEVMAQPYIAKHTPNPVAVVKKTPLNLDLPTFAGIKNHYVDSKNMVLKLFQQEAKPAIRYNAELIFDEEKSESITGGKVNITIPFG